MVQYGMVFYELWYLNWTLATVIHGGNFLEQMSLLVEYNGRRCYSKRVNS